MGSADARYGYQSDILVSKPANVRAVALSMHISPRNSSMERGLAGHFQAFERAVEIGDSPEDKGLKQRTRRFV